MLIRTKLFFSHFLAVLLVSGSIGTYFYKQSTGSLLESQSRREQAMRGVAEAGRDEEVAEVVRRADEALYRAKQEGRNRVAQSA